jgi:hypothetical protein
MVQGSIFPIENHLLIFSNRKSRISHWKSQIFASSVHSVQSTIQPWDSITSTNGFKKKSQEPEFKLTPQESEAFQQIKRSIQRSSYVTPEDVTKSLQSDQVC